MKKLANKTNRNMEFLTHFAYTVCPTPEALSGHSEIICEATSAGPGKNIAHWGAM